MQKTNKQPEPGWEAATYEGAERLQLIHAMGMSFTAKLEWLEGAQEVAEMFQRAKIVPKPADAPQSAPPSSGDEPT